MDTSDSMRHIVYIPGFGDNFDTLRRLALRRWRRRDTKVTFVPMRWSDRHETYEAKYARVAKVIEQINANELILVGESAGGAMALFAFSRHLGQIDRVMTVCGYNHGAADVHHHHQQAHPAFYQLMPVVDEIVANFVPTDLQCITTIYSPRDHIVTPEHSRITGAHQQTLHTPGHFISIANCLLHNPTR